LFGYRGRSTIPPARDREITSIGLTFQTHNPFGLSPMPQSGEEAASIAALFGTQPVLEEDATEAAVIYALQHSHYVHLSTHGRHDANAPAFQSLFVTPDETSDGIIHAYEILTLDLRGIDVLTLSACETALGRFDPGDNLRGLPASFLLAGVSTLIGTLWEVDASASETFFVAFYTELKAGIDRRDAFAKAQRETRSAFPRYAHWAAFYFIGAWK
jgi:CHAT domain-containing protein